MNPCPSWRRLPTDTEWNNILPLFIWKYTSTWIWAPFYLPVAGYESYGMLYDKGTYGYYLSSTEGGSSGTYILNVFTSSAIINNAGKDEGNSVRCVKD